MLVLSWCSSALLLLLRVPPLLPLPRAAVHEHSSSPPPSRSSLLLRFSPTPPLELVAHRLTLMPFFCWTPLAAALRPQARRPIAVSAAVLPHLWVWHATSNVRHISCTPVHRKCMLAQE